MKAPSLARLDSIISGLEATIADLQQRKEKVQKIVELKKVVEGMEKVLAVEARSLPSPPIEKRSSRPLVGPSEMVALAVKECGESFHVTKEEFFSKSRQSRIALARQVVFFIATTVAGLSRQAVGDVFAMNHSNVTYGCQTVQDYMDTDARFRTQVNQLVEKCRTQVAPPPSSMAAAA